MDDIPKIGITGMPSVGKTKTLIKIIEKIENSGYRIEGMITEPIVQDKKRVGFYVMDWQTKDKEVFSHIDAFFDRKYKLDKKEPNRFFDTNIETLDRNRITVSRSIKSLNFI